MRLDKRQLILLCLLGAAVNGYLGTVNSPSYSWFSFLQSGVCLGLGFCVYVDRRD